MTALRRVLIEGQAARASVFSGAGAEPDCRKEFVCPEESARYAGMLEQMVFSKSSGAPPPASIIEFGSGTGEPIISAILKSGYTGRVDGYEINATAAAEARALIVEHGLLGQYVVHDASFFEAGPDPRFDCLIANPPYLPCERGDVLTLPDLWGGIDGIDISKRLLSCGYPKVFLLVSSYSNPAALIGHARRCGYGISDFQVSKMSFGVYSRQDHVQRRIREMLVAGTAFFSENCYLVGGAVFSKDAGEPGDLSAEFLASLCCL
jgi:Methyltransferase small domain